MLLLLDYSSHYPSKLVEITEEELHEINRVEGKKYLQDTPEGRALIKKLEAKPKVPVVSVTCYI